MIPLEVELELGDALELVVLPPAVLMPYVYSATVAVVIGILFLSSTPFRFKSTKTQ